jgi:uncharacterized membrane protein
VFYGAMLLFLTNLTGIILAAGLSFMVIGYAPFSRAKKGIALSAFMVRKVVVPVRLQSLRLADFWQYSPGHWQKPLQPLKVQQPVNPE